MISVLCMYSHVLLKIYTLPVLEILKLPPICIGVVGAAVATSVVSVTSSVVAELTAVLVLLPVDGLIPSVDVPVLSLVEIDTVVALLPVDMSELATEVCGVSVVDDFSVVDNCVVDAASVVYDVEDGVTVVNESSVVDNVEDDLTVVDKSSVVDDVEDDITVLGDSSVVDDAKDDITVLDESSVIDNVSDGVDVFVVVSVFMVFCVSVSVPEGVNVWLTVEFSVVNVVSGVLVWVDTTWEVDVSLSVSVVGDNVVVPDVSVKDRLSVVDS